MEKPYIIFQSGGLKFLIEMDYIDTIEEAGKVSTGAVPVYDFGRNCGLENSGESARYTLILRKKEDCFGVLAGLVEDMKAISEEDIIALQYPVRSEKNSYLAGAVHLEAMEPPVLYTLDIKELYRKMNRHAPDYWY